MGSRRSTEDGRNREEVGFTEGSSPSSILFPSSSPPRSRRVLPLLYIYIVCCCASACDILCVQQTHRTCGIWRPISSVHWRRFEICFGQFRIETPKKETLEKGPMAFVCVRRAASSLGARRRVSVVGEVLEFPESLRPRLNSLEGLDSRVASRE